MGGMLTALAPDWNRAVLGVTGIDYANLLVQRSTDFAPFGTIVYAAYPDESLHPLILDLMQQLWDRGDPDGYAEQMTTHPLPDTPPHPVLMQIAYGDFQVSMYAAAVEARTIGASAYRPALDPDRSRDAACSPDCRRSPSFRSRDRRSRSGTQVPAACSRRPSRTSLRSRRPNNIDPHEDVRNTPAAQLQMSDFWQPDGKIVNICGGQPCHSSVYTPWTGPLEDVYVYTGQILHRPRLTGVSARPCAGTSPGARRRRCGGRRRRDHCGRRRVAVDQRQLAGRDPRLTRQLTDLREDLGATRGGRRSRRSAAIGGAGGRTWSEGRAHAGPVTPSRCPRRTRRA